MFAVWRGLRRHAYLPLPFVFFARHPPFPCPAGASPPPRKRTSAPAGVLAGRSVVAVGTAAVSSIAIHSTLVALPSITTAEILVTDPRSVTNSSALSEDATQCPICWALSPPTIPHSTRSEREQAKGRRL